MAAMDMQSSESGGIQVQLAGATDIGGGRENQDTWFGWTDPSGSGTVVFGVLDGHGRELGRVAAMTGRDHIIEWLADPKNLQLLRDDCTAAFKQLFESTHQSIKSAFWKKLQELGWEVCEAEGSSYLVRRRHEHMPWVCVHGGSSCSVVVLLDGERLLSANVGDSSVILGLTTSDGTTQPIPQDCMVRVKDLGSAHLHSIVVPKTREESNAEATRKQRKGNDGNAMESPMNEDMPSTPPVELLDSRLPIPGETFPPTSSSYLLFCADHSPESPFEFERLRRAHPSPDPTIPMVLMVYDSPSSSVGKSNCPPIFELKADTSAHPIITNKGKYYKNVRSEWASLIATPRSARFQDALAFTRSLGDLHLQTYGVSYLPEIFEIDVAKLFAFPSIVTIVACTDGVWDNWKFEECMHVAASGEAMQTLSTAMSPLEPGTIHGVNSQPSSSPSQTIVNKLIVQNARRARQNFGNSADNATGIVAYLWRGNLDEKTTVQTQVAAAEN